jgi:DNA polymerase-3 subunit alpha
MHLLLTDHANLMGYFSLCRDVLNHNKSAEAKNAALIADGESLQG